GGLGEDPGRRTPGRPAGAGQGARGGGPRRRPPMAHGRGLGPARGGARPVTSAPAGAQGARVAGLLDRRTEASRLFFAAEAERTATLCHRMAERFARGGRLVAVGASPPPRSHPPPLPLAFPLP